MTKKIKGEVTELHISSGRIGDKIILLMNDSCAAWLVDELEAPTAEWKGKRGELAGLLRLRLRRACQ
jgi:hypothetical protein